MRRAVAVHTGDVPAGAQQNLTSLLSSLFNTSTMNDENATPLTTFIRQNLKYSTIMRFAGSLARSKLPRSGVQGYDSSEVVISAPCDMDSFVAITRTAGSVSTSDSSRIHSPSPSTVNNSLSVRFNPSKHAFLQPSRATSSLSVDFTRLSELLRFTQIRDNQDHSTIGVKECKGKTGHLLRLLGSSCRVTIEGSSSNESEGKGLLEVDCVLPFQSCTSNFKNHIKSFLQSIYIAQKGNVYQREVPSGSDTLFYRFRENYDHAQGRFLSPWKAVMMDNTCYNSSSTVGTERSTTDDSTFSIEWYQNPLPRHCTWTSDASYFGQQVLGQVTSFFPCITFFGDATISEIRTLINNYLL